MRYVLVLLLAVGAAAAQDNLLRNPGFEEVANGRPVAWDAENWGTGGEPRVAAEGHNGRYAGAVVCASDQQRAIWRQIVPCQGPGTITFNAWYRTSYDQTSGGEVRGAVVRFLFFRDAAKWDHPSIPWSAAPPSRDWRRFTRTLRFTDEITAIGIELFNLSTAGSVWWDDVELRLATPEEVEALMREEYAAIDRPPEPDETGYAPEDGSTAPMNPPVFVWLRLKEASEYVLQWSRHPEFPAGETETVRCKLSIYAPRHVFDAGRWYWRFGVQAPPSLGMVYSRTRAFEVSPEAPKAPFPDVGEVVRRLSTYRPRDFVPPDGLDDYRALAQGELKSRVEAMRRDAEGYLGQELLPEPPFLPPTSDPNWGAEYTRIFRATRPFNAGMVACAQVYLLTGEERFGQEARRRLMHLMSWDPNGSTSLFHHDEPGTELVRLCPRVFDWIHPLLSEEDKRKCREVLAVRIPQLYQALSNRPFETRPYSSHDMDYYITDLTEACVAMAGELPVEEMFEYVLTQLWSPFYPPYGGADGGWCEGPSYWQWSTGNFVRTFHLVKMVTGCDITWRPWLQNTPYFKLYCNPPYSQMSPFGDGQSSRAGGGDTMYKLGVTLANPYALWYADQQQARPYGIEQFLFRRDGLEAKPPSDLPQARCFADIGLACMHSDLADGSRNVHFMLRSCPFGAISHAYADQNAFILHAYGEPLAIASGYYPYYASPHHKSWTWETKAANSILVDGEGQRIRDWTSRGRIVQFATSDYCHYAWGDAHEAYPGRLTRFDRHALYLRPQSPDEEPVVVIYDDLEATRPATYQWLLHALEEMRVDSGARTIEVTRGGARLQVRFLVPQGLQFTQTDQFTVPPEADNLPNQWHLTASTTAPAARQRFLTVLLPYREGQRPASVQARETPGFMVVEIAGATLTHTVSFRTGEGPSAGPVGGDVTAIARDASGQVRSAFAVNWEQP